MRKKSPYEVQSFPHHCEFGYQPFFLTWHSHSFMLQKELMPLSTWTDVLSLINNTVTQFPFPSNKAQKRDEPKHPRLTRLLLTMTILSFCVLRIWQAVVLHPGTPTIPPSSPSAPWAQCPPAAPWPHPRILPAHKEIHPPPDNPLPPLFIPRRLLFCGVSSKTKEWL